MNASEEMLDRAERTAGRLRKELATANKRIEELERESEWKAMKIDAAWSFRETDPNGCIDAALSCFNILPCEECGGSGRTVGFGCLWCHCHGWRVDNAP